VEHFNKWSPYVEFWFTDDYIPPSVTAAIRLPQRHMMTHGFQINIVEISVCIAAEAGLTSGHPVF
jgi:hypothetical protein